MWILRLKKGDDMDALWERLLMALIGEGFKSTIVIGAVLSLRKKEKLLELWLSEYTEESMADVSNNIRKTLGLDSRKQVLYFKSHSRATEDSSTMKNAEGFKF